MSATLRVQRESVIMELRRGRFEISLDDATAGSIERHGRFERSIEPGGHTLRVRAGRYSSRAESFDVADGDTIQFRCSGARIWPIYLVSFLVPDLALTLRREPAAGSG